MVTQGLTLPTITIVVTIWMPAGPIGEMRARSTLKTLESWRANLKYDGKLRLHFADDGSQFKDFGQSLDTRPCVWWDKGEVAFSRAERRGVGASLNRGFREGFQYGEIVAYFVDDWALSEPIDLTPWAKLMILHPEVGMVRLGPPHPDLTGIVKMYYPGWGLLLDRHNFAFAFRPALYHRRFYEAYGLFREDVNSYIAEQHYNDEVFCRRKGPEIVYALPYPWYHVGDAEVGYIDPKEAS